MAYDPNTMPTTLDEWNQLIDYYYNKGQADYEAEKAAATQQAEQAYKNLPDENKPTLEDFIAQSAVMTITPPPTRESLETLYAMYLPKEQEDTGELTKIAPPLFYSVYKVGDQYWSVADAKFVPEPEDKDVIIILGGEPTIQNLRETLKLFAQSDSRIKLGPEIMDTEELFAALRAKRDVYLAEYDKQVAQLNRLIRDNPDYAAYQLQRATWDEYATALCRLPQREDAPWDGGGPLTPWPAMPEAASE